MPFNGAGTYTLPGAYNPVVADTVILADWANTTFTDVAGALTNTITRDGQSIPTANLPMGGFRHTNVGAATSGTQYTRGDQEQTNALRSLNTTGGGPLAYTALQVFGATTFTNYQQVAGSFPLSNNAGAVTLSINGSTAVPIKRMNGSDLSANDIVANVPVVLIYVSGFWYILTGPGASGLAPLSTLYVPLDGSVAMTGYLGVDITSTGSLGGITTWVQTWRNLAGNTDGKRWAWGLDKNGALDRLSLNTINDASGVGATLISVQRTGTAGNNVYIGPRVNINFTDNTVDQLQVGGTSLFSGGMQKIIVPASGSYAASTQWVQEWQNSNGNTDGKRWIWFLQKPTTHDQLSLGMMSDAGVIGQQIITLQRTGNSNDFIALNARTTVLTTDDGATALQVGGDAILTGLMQSRYLNITDTTYAAATVAGGITTKELAFAGFFDNGNSGTTKTINFQTNGQYQKLTMNNACTLTWSFPGPGVYQIDIYQDGTGSRVATFPAGKWTADTTAAGKLLSTAINARDLLIIRYNGTDNIYQLMKGLA